MAAVAEKRMGRPKTSLRDDVTVKIDRRLATRAKFVASLRGIPLAELVSDMLTTPVDKAFAQAGKELEKP
jgi:hypothetical protein